MANGQAVDLQTVVQALQNIATKLGAIAQVGMPSWSVSPPNAVATHSNAAGSFLIKTGPGAVVDISINSASSGSLTVYDGTSASGTVLGIIQTNTTGLLATPWPFKTGLFVVQSGTADVTIVSH